MVGLSLLVSLVASAPRLELRVSTPSPGACAWHQHLEQQLRLRDSAVLTSHLHADATLDVSTEGDGVRVRVTARTGELLAERVLQRASCSTWVRLVALLVDRAAHDVRWSGSTSVNTPTVPAPTPDIPLPPRPPAAPEPGPDAGPPALVTPSPAPLDAGRDDSRRPPTQRVDAGLAALPPLPQFDAETNAGSELRRPSFEALDSGAAELLPVIASSPSPPSVPLDAGVALELPLDAPEAPDAGPPLPSAWSASLAAGYAVVPTSEALETGPTLSLLGTYRVFFASADGTLHVVPTQHTAVVIQGRERGQLSAGSGTARLSAGLCLRRGALSLCGGPSASVWLQRVTATGDVFQTQPAFQVAPLVGGQVRPSLTLSHFTASLLVDVQAALSRRRAEVDGTTAALSTPSWTTSVSVFMGLRLP